MTVLYHAVQVADPLRTRVKGCRIWLSCFKKTRTVSVHGHPGQHFSVHLVNCVVHSDCSTERCGTTLEANGYD